MKIKGKYGRTMRLVVLVAALAAGCGIGVVDGRAEGQFTAGLEIGSAADFYAPLNPYGFWVDVRPYGRCWHPGEVPGDWRPYCNGHWEWTDCGWYWVSDEPWAWACYHYGSWVYDPTYGWLWIPGTEWAPAWVVWRDAPDYVGWAPCGPGGVVLAPSYFVFVDIHHFHDRIRPGTVIVNDPTIIQRTTVVNFTRERRSFGGTMQTVVINRGPSVDVIQLATGTRFAPRPVHEFVSQTPAPREVRRDVSGPVRIERPVQEQPPARTGREQPRIYQQPQAPRREAQPNVAPRVAPAQPQPPQRWQQGPAVIPPQPQVPPPTGRERGYERFDGQATGRRELAPPPPRSEREAPRPQGPPPREEKPRDRDER